MSEPGTPTFDQLRIFLTVVEAGSFAAAGRRLNRATSVISYVDRATDRLAGKPSSAPDGHYRSRSFENWLIESALRPISAVEAASAIS